MGRRGLGQLEEGEYAAVRAVGLDGFLVRRRAAAAGAGLPAHAFTDHRRPAELVPTNYWRDAGQDQRGRRPRERAPTCVEEVEVSVVLRDILDHIGAGADGVMLEVIGRS
jgi:hypothetical protein